MTRLRQIVSRYPLSLLCLLTVWYLSLFFLPPDKLDLSGVAFIDKWTHFVMYGGTCSVIWWEYLRSHRVLSARRLFVFAWLGPVLMSGLLELLQEYCTNNRAGEWLDFAANTTGCTLGVVVGLIMAKWQKHV